MNELNRQKVLDYLSHNNTDPLYFHEYTSTQDEFKAEDHTVESMILRALFLCKDYASYSFDTGDYETSSERLRSCIDIWRHIIYYYPEITIFDVMHGMYNLKDKLGGQFCPDVKRRVFASKIAYNKENCFQGLWKNDQDSICNDYTYVDEFKLKWQDWKDI